MRVLPVLVQVAHVYTQVIHGDAASRTIFDSQSGAALATAYRAGALPTAAQQALGAFVGALGPTAVWPRLTWAGWADVETPRM